MSLSQHRMIIALGLLFVCIGCSQTKQYTPQPAASRYELPDLPENLIQVHVNDLRPESSASDNLSNILKTQIESALSDKPAKGEQNSYSLHVDIIEHRAFFTLGNWNSSTKFRIKLMGPDHKIVGQWDAVGSSRRSNMGGYATAKAVSQDSYYVALADMMSALSPVSIRQ